MSEEVSTEDKKKFIKDKGWHTWYSEGYWVHPKTVIPTLDYTSYGMSLDDAYIFEIEKRPPFKGGFLSWLGGIRFT